MIELENMKAYFAQIRGQEPIVGDRFIEGEPIFFVHRFSPEFKSLWLVPISDCHLGNHLFSEHHFVRTVRFINSKPNIFTILNGDLCECAIKSSIGDIYRQTMSPSKQRDWMIDHLRPIQKKILGMTMGNHEKRIYNDSSIDVCADIADALKIRYRPEGITIRVVFGSGFDGHKDRPYVYDIYATHGYGGARTKGGKAVKVERVGHFVHADVYLMSHDHDVNVAPDNYLMPITRTEIQDVTGWEVGKFSAHRKMLVKTNAYLKWGGYGEMLGFSPTDLETPVIKFSGEGKAKVRVEV